MLFSIMWNQLIIVIIQKNFLNKWKKEPLFYIKGKFFSSDPEPILLLSDAERYISGQG